MCEIHFYYDQESLNRFCSSSSSLPLHPCPPPPHFVYNLFLADCSGKEEILFLLLPIITYFPNEIALWFSLLCLRPFHIIGFLNENFSTFLRNLYLRFHFIVMKSYDSFSKIQIFFTVLVLLCWDDKNLLSYNTRMPSHRIECHLTRSTNYAITLWQALIHLLSWSRSITFLNFALDVQLS